MRGIAIAGMFLAACSANKSTGNGVDASHGPGDADGSGDPDAAISDAAPPPDGPDLARPMYALSGANLYKIDLTALTSTLVGAITSGGIDVGDLAGLGFDGANLIGLDATATNLLVIDPDTAQVTASKALSMAGLAGLTVIPANEIGNPSPIYLAATSDSLWRITPQTGGVTLVGTFSDGSAFSTDLAWVHAHGLYITVKVIGNGTATGVDLVQIDPTNATTIADLKSGYNNMNGLSGYRGHLWAVSGGGNVYAIDLGSGTLMSKLTGGPSYTEAAQ